MLRAIFLFCIGFSTLSALAQGTVFIYEGRLNDGSQPANGTYDLTFTLYDSTNQPGHAIAGTATNLGTRVTAGLFNASLDFGGAFDGSARWLEIGVRTNGAANFVTLFPRQPLTPVPYAIFAGATSNLIGTLSPENVAPLTSLIASSSNGLYSSINSSWSTNLASSTGSGIISSNEYAKLNGYPNAFDVIAPLPPVMINTWWFGGNGDVVTTNTMAYLATNGVVALARKYNTPFYYVQDDLWMDGTNIPNGIFQPEPHLWPNGMKVIADFAHAHGERFGIYPQSSVYGMNCTNLYGNATNFLAWGLDYLKFELGFPGGTIEDQYMLNTLLYPFWTNGHPVFVESGCPAWSPAFAGVVQSPRCVVLGDAYTYANLLGMINYTRTFSPFTIGPGRGFFPSIDYVNGYLSADEEREHWTAEAMIPAVWAFSFSTNQLTAFPALMQSITNEDVFSINQDPLVNPGVQVFAESFVTVFERRCVSNTFAISIENQGPATSYTLWFTNLPGVPAANLVRDCWAHTNCVATDSFTIAVPHHSAALLRLMPLGGAFTPLTNIIAVNWPGSMVTSTLINGVQTIAYRPIDRDASNYIARAGITGNPSEMLAAAVAVSLGKQHGWWTNWDALYLFRGSTSNSTAQNLVSTNYNIVWHTPGTTFDWAGVTGDGTNGYGDTQFNPRTAANPHFTTNSASLFVYNRTAAPGGVAGYHTFIGNDQFPGAALYSNNDSHNMGLFGLNAVAQNDIVNMIIEGDSGDFTGYILATRYANNAQTIFHNRVTGNTIDSTPATALPNGTFFILGANGGVLSEPSGCNLSLAGIGAGMTPSQWLVFQSDMNTIMNILGL